MTQCNGTVFKNETNNLFKLEPSFKLVNTFFTAKVSINFLVLLKMTLKMKTSDKTNLKIGVTENNSKKKPKKLVLNF